jgi:hypothetical protein
MFLIRAIDAVWIADQISWIGARCQSQMIKNNHIAAHNGIF